MTYSLERIWNEFKLKNIEVYMKYCIDLAISIKNLTRISFNPEKLV